MKKQFIATALLSTALLGAVVTSTSAKADITTDTIDEKWGKPTLVYGGGLSDEQVTIVNNALGIKNIDNVTRQIVIGTDMDKYLGTSGFLTSNMYSSVLVQKKDKGNGVDVEIKTPENITRITELQYANAAITAGATDVEIDVVAPFEVTGESALTGVYKALEANGETLDSERTLVAQQELETVNEVAQAHAENEKFDSASFDKVLADIKTKLADYKDKNGQVASDEIIEGIINEALKANGLDGVITADEVSKLVTFAKAYQETSAIDSAEVAKQLNDFKDKATAQVSEAFTKLQDSGVLEKVGTFFEELWKGLVGLFG